LQRREESQNTARGQKFAIADLQPCGAIPLTTLQRQVLRQVCQQFLRLQMPKQLARINLEIEAGEFGNAYVRRMYPEQERFGAGELSDFPPR
jgi:hypothetical protein